MRLHPRLFNRFLVITAIISAAAILFFGIRYQANQESALRERVGSGAEFVLEKMPSFDVPGDSVRVIDYAGRWVLLQFWSTWSPPSLDALHSLPHRPDLIVIAAHVRDDSTSVADYLLTTSYDHRFVAGTTIFQKYAFTGVPSFVLFDPNGRLHALHVGFADTETVESYLP
jgi:hypothetical protein